MKSCILATWVTDGFGDYVHFHDIVKTIQNRPQYQSIEFTLIIMNSWSARGSVKAQRIETHLQSLTLPYYHWTEDEWENPNVDNELIKKFSAADQLVFISLGESETFPDKYQDAIRNLPKKHICEHDIVKSDEYKNNDCRRRLGLGMDCYGFKIKPVSSAAPANTWEVIHENDPVFAKKLLGCTDSETFDVFINKNVLIPAYVHFNAFFFCKIFPKLVMDINYPEEEKNLIIYYSGSNLSDVNHTFIDEMIYRNIKTSIGGISGKIPATTIISKILEKTKFKSVEIIQPGDTPLIVIPGNPNGTQCVKILSGFFVTDASYEAILKQANIAGVSGDNGLEDSVSMNILPLYYHPFTHSKTSILTLKHMIQDGLIQRAGFFFSDEAKESFQVFLSPDACSTDYPKLNFPAMIAAWPQITAYLRKYHNFYDALDQIMFDPSATVHFSDEKSHQKSIEKICYLKAWFLSQLELPHRKNSLSDKFSLNLRHTVTLIADLFYKKLMPGEDAQLLLDKLWLIVNDRSQYRQVLTESTHRKGVFVDKLCAYMMLTAGYAAQSLASNNKDNEWVKQANKRLKQIDAIDTSLREDKSRCCVM